MSRGFHKNCILLGFLISIDFRGKFFAYMYIAVHQTYYGVYRHSRINYWKDYNGILAGCLIVDYVKIEKP